MTELELKTCDKGIPCQDEHSDRVMRIIQQSVRQEQYQMARARFIKLTEALQAELLGSIPAQQAVRLAASLPTLTVARLFSRLPKDLGRSIVQSLPDGKRRSVMVILSHQRQAKRHFQGRQLQG